MRQRDEQPVVLVERGGGVGTFIAGAAIGALVALLLAPQSGAETRAQLKARMRRLREAAEDKLDDLQEAVEVGYEKTKASIEAGLQRAIDGVLEERAAVDLGKLLGASVTARHARRQDHRTHRSVAAHRPIRLRHMLPMEGR